MAVRSLGTLEDSSESGSWSFIIIIIIKCLLWLPSDCLKRKKTWPRETKKVTQKISFCSEFDGASQRPSFGEE